VFRENDLDSAPYKDRNGEENTQAVDYPVNVKQALVNKALAVHCINIGQLTFYV